MNNDWTLKKWEAPVAPDQRTEKEKEWQVLPLANQQDFECVLLGRFGMTMATIAQFTGLSKGQVSYRLKKAGIRTTDFRYGKGEFASMVFGVATKPGARLVISELRTKELQNEQG